MTIRNTALLILSIAILIAIEISPFVPPLKRFLLGITGTLVEQVGTFRGVPNERAVHDVRTLLVAQEVAELKAQLNFRTRSEHASIGARISGYATDPVRTLLLVDRGARDGVQQGAPVIAGDGLLVGTVQAVDDTTSTILPIHDPRSTILTRIPHETREIHGITKGRFNVGADLSYIPITEELRIGDIAVTSGLQAGIPQGLVIGTIREVRKRPEELFQSAALDIPYATQPPLIVSIIYEEH